MQLHRRTMEYATASTSEGWRHKCLDQDGDSLRNFYLRCREIDSFPQQPK